MTDKPSFFAELKRRNVLRAATLYAAGAWLLVQIITQVGPVFDLPASTQRWAIVALAIGSPFAMLLSWFYELTPGGFKRDSEVEQSESIERSTGKALDRWIITVLTLAVVLLLTDRLVLHKTPETAATPVVARGKSIAVLPFLDLSEKKDQEYFGDGMSDELLSTLGKIRGLRVAARTTSFAFKGEKIDVREIGRRIDVATVLEGSVERDGNRVRIRAELVDVAMGNIIWNDSYDREVGDLFAVQDEIAGHIVDALKIRLAIAIPTRRPIDTEAYDLYMQGMFYSNKSTEADLRNGLDLFERSLRKDPNNAKAWSGIAKVWLWLADAYVKPLDAYPASKAAALKALALDPDDVDAHVYLSESMRVLDRNVVGAEAQLRKALQIDPDSGPAHMFLALLLSVQGDRAGGMDQIALALKAEPRSAIISRFAGLVYLANNRYDDAINEAKRLHGLDPSFQYLGSLLADTYREQGRYAEAIVEYRKAEAMTGVPDQGLAITYARMGRIGDARRILGQLEALSEHGYFPADEIAAIHVALGQKNEAFKWLQRALDEHSAPLHGVAVAPEFRALRGDPRFAVLLARLGLDPKRVLAASP